MPRYGFETEVRNEYLGKKKIVKASSSYELKIKAEELMRKWDEEANKLHKKISLQKSAEDQTREAIEQINAYKSILIDAANKSSILDWEVFLDKTNFREFEFNESCPVYVEPKHIPISPLKSSWEFLIPSKKKKRIEAEEKDRKEREYLIHQAKEKHQNKMKEFNKRYEESLESYNSQKEEFLKKQSEKNSEVNSLKQSYEEGKPEGIEKCIDLVLTSSKYPKTFNKDFEVGFDSVSKFIVVDYKLISKEDIPSVIEYKFVASKQQISEKKLTKKAQEDLYESIVYQVTLRTMYEVLNADYHNHIHAIVFNGWIDGTDPATGNDFTSCIITCQATKEELSAINLEKVNPKDCVRSLKGLVAGPLHKIAPVKPIMQLNRNDSRFVTSVDVLNNLDDSLNLAEMDWEEFEHLVRELFGEIFSTNGTEVKVTQASRDGGVDAVAFDPDPIRGGKFVIQAKRYNNVVPVSAVRDLYGTMISEGAVKGILVTTSYYGPDSREFVKDKPISLIDGANLVYMLQQHGYNARIELRK